MMQTFFGFILLLILLGIGSCVYNVRESAKHDFLIDHKIDGQALILNTTNGKFKFELKNIESIEIVH